MHDEIVVRIKPAILLYQLAKRWWYLNISLCMEKVMAFIFGSNKSLESISSIHKHLIFMENSPIRRIEADFDREINPS